jgi:DNA-binding transcriptional regulator YiaG
VKNKKKKTFVFKGLGFPIKLVNAPMKKEFGDWYIDIDMNKLMRVVLEALTYKPAPLTAEELRFIRSYLQMTTTEFGKLFGVSHVTILKWESGENKISPSLEFCIRLYISDYLHTKDAEFRAFYKELSLEQLSKKEKKKIHPFVIDATTDDLKIAL